MKCKLELWQQDARASRCDDRPLRFGPIWRRRFANCGRFCAVLAHGGVVLLFAVLVAGCGNPAGSHSNLSVRVDGSSTVYPISAAVAEAFDDERRAAELPPIRVPSGFSGTGGGFKRFAAGEIDICDASREIKPSEAEACRKAGIEYVVFSIAYDGIAIVVHPECDWTDRLTVAQLKELWQPDSGVQRWSDLDPSWPEEKIQLLGPGTDSGTFDYFTTAINGEAGSSRSDFTPSEDDNVIVQGVAGDRYALGYFGYAYYAENMDRLKVLAVDDGDGGDAVAGNDSQRHVPPAVASSVHLRQPGGTGPRRSCRLRDVLLEPRGRIGRAGRLRER
ncbi:MAG: PstS family phosphate ABC transporter substrate-binding protein [Pirellulales bacterium]